MNLSIEQLSSLVSVLGAVAAWAVIPYRVNQLERRLERLESSERDFAERMAGIEAELRLTRHTVEKIADKLEVS
jgi:hypothetical protein